MEKELKEILALAENLFTLSKQKNVDSFDKRIKPFITSEDGKHFLIRLMDTAFRTNSLKRITNFVYTLFSSQKSYESIFTSWEKSLIKTFMGIGYKIPAISIPLMLVQIRTVSDKLLFYTGSKSFKKHTKYRRSQRVKLNVNLIGESLLGEEDAKQRIKSYKELLNQEEVNYISIKVSTIYSQIKPIAFEETVQVLMDRLSELYREVLAIEERTGIQKFINLDMEEYRDLSITVEVFIRTLSKLEFTNLRAGIVLQAYIPDSYSYLLRLKKWAITRKKSGGEAIKIRIVKGANLEMEKVESSMENWNLVTYESKVEVDANFKKMLLEIIQGDVLQSVNLGVASHNIFDLAFAIYHSKKVASSNLMEIEMLEGMANSLVLVLLEQKLNVLLYTPIVHKKDFTNAIAYLVRRLDEGTAKGNFLREAIGLQVGSDKWNEIEQQFVNSYNLIETVSNEPKRSHNRLVENYKIQASGFSNALNTDWVLPNNRLWLEGIRAKWENKTAIEKINVEFATKLEIPRTSIQQTNWQGVLPWSYELASEEDYTAFIHNYKYSEWLGFNAKQRIEIIKKCAIEIENARADLIGVASTELGKLVSELDVEISEAVDFANFYAHSMEELLKLNKVSFSAKGINLVLSPWNFPIAIPCGGLMASLVSGNAVILKPSQNAAATALILCKALWKAGIPKSALGFLPAKEKTLDAFLASHCPFASVILTGGTDTAKMLLTRNPHLPLFAETGGKNATIVTALSDREQAIKNVIQSAFGNTGQKCSATSLLILEEEVFNDKHFKSLLKDAVLSQKIGFSWSFDTAIGPLACPVSDKLVQAIHGKGEWLVKPEVLSDFQMSPGVLWDVKQGDFCFENELFGPVLSVVKAKNLEHAVEIANSVEFGLTSGLESLVSKEIEYWKDTVEAGNLYINRPTTGAIVERQAFGGVKKSCFGFGAKAGGYNYLLQFLNVEDNIGLDYVDLNETVSALKSTNLFTDLALMKLQNAHNDYEYWNEVYFSKEIDYSKVRGQFNLSRFRKPKSIELCINDDTEIEDLALVYLSSQVLKLPLNVFYQGDSRHVKFLKEMKINSTKVDSWEKISSSIDAQSRYRVLNNVGLFIGFSMKFHQKAIHIYRKKPTYSGRIELLNYLSEQSISHNYHRYGNLMGEGELDS